MKKSVYIERSCPTRTARERGRAGIAEAVVEESKVSFMHMNYNS